MWSRIFNLLNTYMGTGFFFIWYLLMLVVLLFREKKRERRVVFVYAPLVILVVFFNPLVAAVFYRFADEETYYRLLWLLPVTVTLAYGCTCLVLEQKGKRQIALLIGFLLLVMGGGSLIYKDANMKKAENIYHVPQIVVDICDEIEIEGREIMVVFPPELVQYTRQYSALICQPYGRETLVDRWNAPSEIADIMSENLIDADHLGDFARQYQTHYIVLRQDQVVEGSLEDNGFAYYKSIGEYDLYRSTIANFDV